MISVFGLILLCRWPRTLVACARWRIANFAASPESDAQSRLLLVEQLFTLWSCRGLIIPPSHRRRGATAVLVRHKPQWHRHYRRGSTVVPALIVVAPRKTVKTADLCGGTAATFNMFRRASAVLVPSHRRRGGTAVLVRYKPHWHRHDRRGSAVVPSVIAVAPQKTVKIADLRGGTAETLNMFKTSAGHRGVDQSAVESPRHRHDRSGTAVVPP